MSRGNSTELTLGEGVAGGDKFSGAVRTREQGRQIPAGRLAGMPGRLEMVACRREVTRLTTAGRDGVGLARADRVNVEAVEAERECPGGNGLDGHGGVPVGEVDGGIGDVFAVGGIQLCGQLSSAGPRRGC